MTTDDQHTKRSRRGLASLPDKGGLKVKHPR